MVYWVEDTVNTVFFLAGLDTPPPDLPRLVKEVVGDNNSIYLTRSFRVSTFL